jgi:hypothetical protein
MVGLTPVVWVGRPSEVLSAQLNAGTHGASAEAASTAWGATAGGWSAETAPGTGFAIGQLGVGMQGSNGLNANSALGRFVVWANEMAAQASAVAAAAQAHTVSYNAAWIAMPQAPQIASTDSAVVASANPPGALSGAAEIADTAKAEMEAQASAAMEAYDAASAPLAALPVDFPMPPSITDIDYAGNGLAQLIGEVQQLVQQAPAALQQASQVASTAASVGSQAVSMAATAGENAVSAISSTVGEVATAPMGAATVGLGAAGLGAVTFAGGAGLPEGWGGATMSGGPVGSGLGGMRGGLAEQERPASRTSFNTAVNRKTEEEQEEEHETPEYLKNFEHFADGRTIAPGVIGAVTEAEPDR